MYLVVVEDTTETAPVADERVTGAPKDGPDQQSSCLHNSGYSIQTTMTISYHNACPLPSIQCEAIGLVTFSVGESVLNDI